MEKSLDFLKKASPQEDSHKLLFPPMQRHFMPFAFTTLCAIFASVFFCLPFAEVQAQPFTKHSWLNADGVNYTLSAPTSDGNWIIAAPRRELIQKPDGTSYLAPRKNTIAVLRVDNPDYAITQTGPCADNEVSVIGKMMMTPAGKEVFDPEVEFEVHCVVQSINPDTAYILCGSITSLIDFETEDGDVVEMDFKRGMVAVLNSQLELISLRHYPDVKIFYSVYAQDGYYFVCGQLQDIPQFTHNGRGIVLRDSITKQQITTPTYMRGFQTTTPWVFHKIAVRKDPAYHQTPSYYEFSVSGSRTTTTDEEITYFAVTPEPIPVDDVPCKTQRDIPVYKEPTKYTYDFPLTLARVYAKPLPELTLWFGFCAMGCDGKKEDNCGNRKIEKNKY